MAKNNSRNRISNSRVFKTPVIKGACLFLMPNLGSELWFQTSRSCCLDPGSPTSVVRAVVTCACRWSVPQSVLMRIDGVHEILWFGVKEGNKWLWFWPTNKTVHGLHGWNVSVSTGNGVSPSAFVECGYTLDFWLFSPSCSAFLWAPGSSYLLYWGEICVRILSPTNT